MSIRCNICGNYIIYEGTKFNSRKEDVIGETYLGIQIFRFYFKCTKCSAELAMKTDSQNIDYVVEAGATRNFEPWRDKDDEIEKEKRKRDSEEMGDAMKSLENRTLESKREMDIMATLDEMKSMKSRHATVSVDEMLAALQSTGEDQGPKEYVPRIDDEELYDDEIKNASVKKQKLSEDTSKPTDVLTNNTVVDDSNGKETSNDKPPTLQPQAVKFMVKPKLVQPDDKEQPVKKQDTQQHASSCLQSLCQYEDDDE